MDGYCGNSFTQENKNTTSHKIHMPISRVLPLSGSIYTPNLSDAMPQTCIDPLRSDTDKADA
jgi:hypothetical protein